MTDAEARAAGITKEDDVLLAARAKYESLLPSQKDVFIKLADERVPMLSEIMLVPDDALSEPVRDRLNEMRRRRARKAASA